MISDDGWVPLTPAEFAAEVQGMPGAPLEQRLGIAQAEGLADNIRRQLRFLGQPDVVELQALKVRRNASDSFERSRAAHARGIDETIKLCEAADNWHANGIYLLTGTIKPGVETRHSAPGSWFDVPKGGGTTDGDVQARLILPIDFDAKRSAGTSATDEEMQRSVTVALAAWKFLTGALGGEQSLAYLHSGNGRQIHIALDNLPPEETKPRIAGVLAGLGSIFNTEHVVVDETLTDAKRILPACGTLKKKGAPNLPERPHRRTAIVTPPEVNRISYEELRALANAIWDANDDAGRSAMEKASGIRSTGSVVQVPRNPGSPFDLANGVDPQKVADWLGLYDANGSVRCPGCGSTDGVDVLRYGLKCLHNRCKDNGVRGFYSNVDLVVQEKKVTPIEAVKQLGVQFGFETRFKIDTIPPPASEQLLDDTGFKWITTDEIFAPLPDTQWLIRDLHIVVGRPTMIAGYGFSGKTLMAQSMALALAANEPVWNFFSTGSTFEVRHLDYEQGRHATLKRYQRLAIGHDIARESLGSRLGVCVFPEVYLDTPGAQDAYARAVDGVSVVVLDALRGATPSIVENDSIIRRCIDNLTRVSEKTGCAFVILHHAGKNRDDDTSDARKLPRGSSAIFDACGCVFTVDGESNRPKKVQQAKSPAEAEGTSIAPFHVAIEDVGVDDKPTAGLRVVRQDSARAAGVPVTVQAFLAVKGSVLQLITNSTEPLTSANRIAARMGGTRAHILQAVKELFEDGAIVQPGGNNTPVRLPREGEVVRTGTEGGPYQYGGTGGLSPVPTDTPGNPLPSRTTQRPNKSEEAASKRAAQAESDATELEAVSPKEWSLHRAQQGWGKDRYGDARAVALSRAGKAQADARKLAEVRAGGHDPQAWATEHDWPDERTSRAMKRIDEIGS